MKSLCDYYLTSIFRSFSGSEIPRVSVSDSRILKDSDEITIFCNISYNSQRIELKTISWIKDGILVKNTRCPDPGASEPLFVTNGGKYTCVVQVLLRNVKLYNVSAYTMIRCTSPWILQNIMDK